MRRHILPALLLPLCLTMTGCLFTVDSKQHTTRSQWSDSELSLIRVGSTDADWLRQTFGEPLRRAAYSDGSQVWRYENIVERHSEVGLFLLFNVDVEKEKTDTLVIELKNDVVSSFWTERL